MSGGRCLYHCGMVCNPPILQDLLYMSLKFVNNIWVLGELKSMQNSTSVEVSLLVINKI